MDDPLVDYMLKIKLKTRINAINMVKVHNKDKGTSLPEWRYSDHSGVFFGFIVNFVCSYF